MTTLLARRAATDLQRVGVAVELVFVVRGPGAVVLLLGDDLRALHDLVNAYEWTDAGVDFVKKRCVFALADQPASKSQYSVSRVDLSGYVSREIDKAALMAPDLDALRAENAKLMKELERERAERKRVWKLYDGARHLAWTIDNAEGIAHNLDLHADKVDCGPDCECGYTESDTNAHVCPKSDLGECSLDVACELRDLAKALRSAKTETTAAETARDAALEHVVRLREAANSLRREGALLLCHIEHGIEGKPRWLRDARVIMEAAARVLAETAPADGGGDG